MTTTVRLLSIGTALLTAAVVLPFEARPTRGSTADSAPFALELTRGTFTPPNATAKILSPEEYCRMVTSAWGWRACAGIDALILDAVPGAEFTMIETASGIGHVGLEGWSEASARQLTRQIEADLRASIPMQSAALGLPVEFVGWRVGPVLDRDLAVVHYAVDVAFDGVPVTNVSAMMFDRRGYVTLGITPDRADLTAAQIDALVRANVAAYRPKTAEAYGAVQAGDTRVGD